VTLKNVRGAVLVQRICPNPIPWHKAFELLTNYAQSHHCRPPSPPTPLILAAWVGSNDIQKKRRWEETVDWAKENGCYDLVSYIPDNDFYFVEEPSRYDVGPMGGPMYNDWSFSPKIRPPSEEIVHLMNILLSRWSKIVGRELASITRPLAFTGSKARRLLVYADTSVAPPWGGWTYLSEKKEQRRYFSTFRAAINKAIAPHEVDHVDFTTKNDKAI
jgi:hypothetical protein